MDNQSEDLIGEKRIFANKESLRPMYIPEKLPHRKKQIKSLADTLSAALKGKTPSNLLIYGKTGTGKTVTVKYVAKQLEARRKKMDRESTLIYINCELFDTQYKVFSYLARVFNKQVPTSGWTTDMQYSEFKSLIDRDDRYVTVILDEMDNLVTRGKKTLSELYYKQRVKHCEGKYDRYFKCPCIH